MKYNFKEGSVTKTMGLRLRLEDYNKISRLAKKHSCSRCSIVSEVVTVALREIKEVT